MIGDGEADSLGETDTEAETPIDGDTLGDSDTEGERLADGETDVDVVVKEVIRVAKIFEQYSAGDLERMVAQKAKE